MFLLLQLRNMIEEYPVLLMPTHRSYMDFLLVSYIFYHYDLPLPVIAAAMGKITLRTLGSLYSVFNDNQTNKHGLIVKVNNMVIHL